MKNHLLSHDPELWHRLLHRLITDNIYKDYQSVCNTHVRRNAAKQGQSCMQYTYPDKYNQTKPVETMKNM
jgi:hypothetical protein